MRLERDMNLGSSYGEQLKGLLEQAKRANMDVDSVMLQFEGMIKKEKLKAILAQHPYRIYEGEAQSNGKVYHRWFTYVADGGKKRQIKRKTRGEIEEYLYGFYTGEVVTSKNKEIVTFNSYFHLNWLNYKKKEKLSDNTIYRYETDYKRFFEGTEFEKINVENIRGVDVLEFVASRVDALSLTGRGYKSLLYYLNDVFEYLMDERIINESPVAFINKKLKHIEKSCTSDDFKNDKDRTISKEDLMKLLDKLRSDYIAKPEYITVYAIEFAILTGCRVDEIAALRWSDISNGIITIRSSEKAHRVKGKPTTYTIEGTKTNKERYIPIVDELSDLLKRIEVAENKLGCKGEFIFSDKNGRI